MAEYTCTGGSHNSSKHGQYAKEKQSRHWLVSIPIDPEFPLLKETFEGLFDYIIIGIQDFNIEANYYVAYCVTEIPRSGRYVSRYFKDASIFAEGVKYQHMLEFVRKLPLVWQMGNIGLVFHPAIRKHIVEKNSGIMRFFRKVVEIDGKSMESIPLNIKLKN